jgi:hypothetical protein
MKIKRMRLLLPARMSRTANMDARVIAEAAARSLAGIRGIQGPIRVEVQGHGRSSTHISQQVSRQIRRQEQTSKREG